MKKILAVLFLIIAACPSLIALSSFTAGNIVVVRVGDGTSTLSSTSAAVFLDEYTTGGTLVQSVAIPTSVSGSNAPLTLSGTATSEGAIVPSVDGRFLTIAGYGAGTGTASIAGTTAATVNRVVARIDANASIDITTQLSDAYDQNNIRGVVTNDGTAFWASGASGGVRYATLGATTSTQLSTTITTTRVINIFNSQLYVTSSTGTFCGISSVGSGLPTTSGQTITLLSGFPTTTASPYGFSINGNTIYVADDRTNGNGGVQKWTYSGSSWSLAYLLAPSSTTGTRGLTVDWTSSNPIIYAITTDNKIVTVTDAGSSSSFTTLITGAAKTLLHGVSFTPIPFISFMNGTSYTPPAGTPNTIDNPIGRFKLAGNITGGRLTQAVVALSGTYSGITNLKLYYSTAATFSVGASTLLATVASPSSPVTFNFSSTPQLIPTAGAYFYVAADLSSGASGAVMASLADPTKLTLTNASLNGTFSGANLSSGNAPLPVELSALTAATTGSTAMIKWSTATEVNNYGFEVERSIILNTGLGTTDWQKIGFVQGAGTSNAPHEYSFTDKNLPFGRYAYRLKQIDRDGLFKYSQPVEVEVGTASNVFSLSQNYPEPFNPTTTINYSLSSNGNVRLTVYNILGSEVAVLVDGEQTAGSHRAAFSGANLAGGIYFYKLEISGQTITKKMILLK